MMESKIKEYSLKAAQVPKNVMSLFGNNKLELIEIQKELIRIQGMILWFVFIVIFLGGTLFYATMFQGQKILILIGSLGLFIFTIFMMRLTSKKTGEIINGI